MNIRFVIPYIQNPAAQCAQPLPGSPKKPLFLRPNFPFRKRRAAIQPDKKDTVTNMTIAEAMDRNTLHR